MASLGMIAFWASTIADPAAVLSILSDPGKLMGIKKIVSFNFISSELGLIIFSSILVVCLIAVKNGFQAIITTLSARYAAFVDGYVGEMLISTYVSMPYEWHTHRNSADLIQTVQWRGYFGNYFMGTALLTLSDVMLISFMLIAVLIANPIISLLTIVVLGSIAYVIFQTIRIILDRNAIRSRDYYLSTNRSINKTLHGIKDVKIFGMENPFIEEYTEELYVLARLQALQRVIGRLPAWILETLGFALLAGGICLMSVTAKSSTANMTGMLALLAVAAWRVLPAINRILAALATLREAVPYVQKIFSYLDETDDLKKYMGATSGAETSTLFFKSEITLCDVSFQYKSASLKTLSRINLSIEKGKTIGIIGPSGSGKSTLADILIGLLPASDGKLMIDGKILDNDLRSTWIQSVGYVPQEPYIHDGSLAQNIAFGLTDKEIERDRIFESCKMAAMEFLTDLPKGIDTLIGERGVRLSGGQRQRVAIARALYKKPQVLIFDEATSSLDTESEREIQKTIYSFKGKLTLIIIAHRLTTVEDCDMLVWIENGRLKCTGIPEKIFTLYAAKGGHAVPTDSNM
ncbi:MAG: ABC transporter ATP-binding protein [Promethearchaeota archaeon]